MPEFGLLTEDAVTGVAPPFLAPLYPALPWTMAGVRVLKLQHETEVASTLALLPAPLTRPSPPYGALIVHDVPESPFGSYRVAAQTIACRYRTYARAFVVQAVVDNPVALAALREVWHYPAKPGEVSIEDCSDGSITGTVVDPRGANLARWTIRDRQPADPGTTVIEPELTLLSDPPFRSDQSPPEVAIVQVHSAYSIRDPERGSCIVEFCSSGEQYPWAAVRPTNSIGAVVTFADRELSCTPYVLEYDSDEAEINLQLA